jgi:hypothetical protein
MVLFSHFRQRSARDATEWRLLLWGRVLLGFGLVPCQKVSTSRLWTVISFFGGLPALYDARQQWRSIWGVGTLEGDSQNAESRPDMWIISFRVVHVMCVVPLKSSVSASALRVTSDGHSVLSWIGVYVAGGHWLSAGE